MARKKKDIILHQVQFFGIADEGKAVGKTEEGQIVFAKGLVPGDVADIFVLKKRKGHIEGRLHTITQYSPDRVEPLCAHFGTCGGCKWQNLDYAAQLRHKENVVENALLRLGKVAVGEWLPILGAENPFYYRNKMEFAFSCKKWLSTEEIKTGVDNAANVLGFHPAGGFDKVINLEHCWLQPDPSNTVRNTIRQIALEQGLSFYDVKKHQGFLRTLMLRITTLNQTMALISFGEDNPELCKPFLEAVQQRLPEITTLLYCINTKMNDTIWDLPIHTWSGQGYAEEQLGELRFRIGPKSFFQTNTRQGQHLYDVVTRFANLQGSENVYDLYTGIGSIGLYVARHCKQVVGIEEVAAAIDDARINTELNGVHNVKFYVGDVRAILTPDFAAEHGKPDLLITDPPRAGMHEDVVNMLLELAAPRIVYVSCNPGTQARDLSRLATKYRVLKVQPVDMFPHTHHIESVALLELNNL
jgi:23S rRNA (uracil1939-C5)-methyltransferase